MANTDVAGRSDGALKGDDIVTVDELNATLASVVESADEVHHDYVVGDATDCGVANGNVHFDLVANGASIHCVLFGSRRDEIGTDPAEDARVAVQGDLSFYEAQGSCSIFVSDIVAMGESEYQQELAAAREALAEDRLFDEDRKQSLPAVPSTVGLVTSADSDAASDAITAIHDRYPDVDIVLQHASVQGNTAIEELLEAISILNRDAAVDVLVVTRGGGADKTLRVFNDPALCRAIAGTDTPICVGVGHEEDRTLAGEVADRRVMTPTHAGEIVPEKTDYVDRVEELSASVDASYEDCVEPRIEDRTESLADAYETHVETNLGHLENRLHHATEKLLATRLTELEQELSAAYESVERVKTLKTEKEAAVAEAQRTLERRRRLYRIAIIVLGLFVILLAAYIIFGP